LEDIINWIDAVVWNPLLVYLILGVGLFYSLATRFVQIRLLKDMLTLTFTRDDSESGISSFQALSLSLGSRVGTGNITGVATAIALGGPGAVFWMWVMAILMGATSFIEITLTQTFKSKLGGEYRGGTPFYIEKGLKLKWLAFVFAFITLIVMGVLWPSLQVNTIALALDNSFHMNRAFTGVLLAVFLAIIIFGGIKRIAKAAEFLVPFMALGYVVLVSVIIILNVNHIPEVLSVIFTSAFGLNAAVGGTIGTAIAFGVQRGAFSNAAGMGSETFEAGAAEVSHPVKQGLVQSFSVYIDTILICSATAFAILMTGIFTSGANPNSFPQLAFNTVFPEFGSAFLAIALLLFCFTTLMSYYYKSETALVFINRNNPDATGLKNILRAVMIITAFVGSILSTDAAWTGANIGLGAMAWINLLCILFLTKPALALLKDYETQKKQKIDPVFDPAKLNIKNAEFWEKENQLSYVVTENIKEEVKEG
jgi:AGCS family alanine or glycine:cation symporter